MNTLVLNTCYGLSGNYESWVRDEVRNDVVDTNTATSVTVNTPSMRGSLYAVLPFPRIQASSFCIAL
jgi:hypothetical protein